MYFAKETDCLSRAIGEETVIVPLKGHVADLESIFSLNDMGSRIWKRLDGQTSVDHLVEEICREYNASEEEVRHDMIDFLEKLRGFGLVETAGG